MRVFFYHTEDARWMYDQWRQGAFPGHTLYGATHFADHGISTVICRHCKSENRLVRMLHTAWQVLTCRQHIDAIFATHYQGMELIILLRALHIYRRKIVVWIHQPLTNPRKRWRHWLGRLFFKGIDEMFFFSEKLMNESIATGKARPDHSHIGHWGPDLDYYDHVVNGTAHSPDMTKGDMDSLSFHGGFISTGRERRDMPTLVKAFNATDYELDIYLNKHNGGIDYEQMFANMDVGTNIHTHFTDGYLHAALCNAVSQARAVVICCLETNYTVGLTTIVEAMALGKPIICSRNPNLPFDFVMKESTADPRTADASHPLNYGITVGYGDVEGWKKAITTVATHTDEAADMGRRARQMAEQQFNDRICAADVAAVLHHCRS